MSAAALPSGAKEARMNTKQHPTGLTAALLSVVAIIDSHWLHSGLDTTEWAAIIGVVTIFVSKLTPRNV